MSVSNILGTGIVVTYIRNGQDTKGSTHVLHEAERTDGIFEITCTGILLHTVLLEIGEGGGKAHVEQHRQGVDISVGCRVCSIHQVAAVKGNAQAVHSSVLTTALLGQLT